MKPVSSSIDALVQAVPGEDDAGVDLRLSPVWSRILDARGNHDTIEKGIWSVEQQPSDWMEVAQLTANLLRDESKDLRLAAWYAEARVRLEGFAAAVESCQLIRRLLENFGSRLHPRSSGDDRVPFVRGIMLFDRCLGGTLKLASILEGDSVKRSFSLADFDTPAAGHLSAQAAAVGPQSIRDALESVEACAAELAVAADTAAVVGPLNFDRSMAALDSWRSTLLSVQHSGSSGVEVSGPLAVKAPMLVEARSDAPVTLVRIPTAAPVRYPEPDMSVIEIRGESRAEPSGRSRFYQKLETTEVCINSGRWRTARVLLAELLEMIGRLNLHEWEPRWATTTVYRNYLQLLGSVSPESGDAELANRIFERWVRFDPPSAMEFESMARKGTAAPNP